MSVTHLKRDTIILRMIMTGATLADIGNAFDPPISPQAIGTSLRKRGWITEQSARLSRTQARDPARLAKIAEYREAAEALAAQLRKLEAWERDLDASITADYNPLPARYRT